MAAGIEEITKEIAELPRHQRLASSDCWSTWNSGGTSDEIQRAWDGKFRARVKAVDEGRAVGVPYEVAGPIPAAGTNTSINPSP